MRFLLTFLLLLSGARAFAANGDSIVYVRDDGWSVDWVVEGATNGGTFNFYLESVTNITSVSGYLQTNVIKKPGPNTPRLTVWSPGHDDTGASNWTSRTVYITDSVRSNYPNQAIEWYGATAGFVTNRVSLKENVYIEDGQITITAPAGVYTQGSVSNSAVSGQSVFNNALISWSNAPVIGNWTWPGLNVEQGQTIRLRAVGFHPSAQLGRPIRAAKFISRGVVSGFAVTNLVTTWAVDHALNMSAPFWNRYTVDKNVNPGEMICDVPTNGFTALEEIRHDVIMYPWYGVPASCANTITGPSGIIAKLTSITNLYDPNNQYSTTIAVVDPAATGGGSAQASTNSDPTLINSANYCLTIAEATTRVAATNNTYFSHNDVGGAIIYVRAGITNFAGGTVTATTKSKAWVTIKPYPGDSVTLTWDTGSDDVNDRVKFDGISMAWEASRVPFSGMDILWIDRAPSMTSISTAPYQTIPVVWVTRSTVGSFAQGLRPSGVQNTSFMLRGNDLTNFQQTVLTRLVMGNVKPTTNGGGYLITTDVSGQTAPPGEEIIYNNYFGGHLGTGNLFQQGQIFNTTNGAFIGNNVFEKCTQAQPVAAIGSSATLAVTNVMVWHNTFEGGRIADLFSSGTETIFNPRWLGSMYGNVWAYPGQKSDINSPEDADRMGEWPTLWMVQSAGNFYIRSYVANTLTSFRPEFAGLYTYEAGITNVINYPRWLDRQAATQVTTTPGNGDYRNFSDSPMIYCNFPTVLPFTIQGVPRGDIDPPGPYSSASPRKGDFIGL